MTQPWITAAVDTAASRLLMDACKVTEPVADVLVARGLTDIQAAQEFIHPSLDRDWSDPCLIPGLEAVAFRLEQAIRAGKRILIFGDFDVDGISATALMLRGLKELGVTADYLIPHRLTEGYGLTKASLRRVYEKEPQLVVTVDCGISARAEVEDMLSQGIEVLITDHHEPSDSVPYGIPVADPKLQKDSPQSILAGAGVALKLMALLGQRLGKPGLWRDLIDLATLGTLGDIMPLVGENRALVSEGLLSLKESPRPGLAALLATARVDAKEIRSTALSFTLIPRLNAAGRMGDPALALRLLVTDDPVQAQDLALALEGANRLRRELEAAIFQEALTQARELDHGQRIMIVAGEGWHEGVKGIVASRLVNRFGVPAIVFTMIEGELRGSGRSVGSVNLFKVVEKCADLALRFGGHEAAVGVTIPQENLEEFKARAESILEGLPREDFLKPLVVDVELALEQADVTSAEQLALFEPLGQKNQEPLFVSKGVFLQNTRAVGMQKNHLSCTVTNGRSRLQAICFKCEDIESYLAYSGPVDILYHLLVDEWNGHHRAKLQIEKIYKREEHHRAKAPEEGLSTREETTLPDPRVKPQMDEAEGSKKRDYWEQQVQTGSTSLIDGLAAEILGHQTNLHDSQRKALQALLQGSSVLAIMATGRGKSLIFQTYAAYLALGKKKASVFIYPLRALIADQARSIIKGFERLGCRACSLTGEDTAEHKDTIFKDLYEGGVDVLLTTPEFFQLHAWRFAQSQRIGFIVFDEAHHIQTELLVGREAYHHLRQCRQMIPDAQYLAVTATSDDRITKGICASLAIDRIIIDDTKRDNLFIDDARNIKDRELYLATLVEQGSKSIIYVNSRAQAIELVRFLRKRTSLQGQSIAFYHAGLAQDDRHAIERMFRSGELTTIISTNAFGEGIDVPDVSQVILYHLPFNDVAFNQLSGRGGRNGQKATIHLLFCGKDAQINRRILAPVALGRSDLVVLYKVVKGMQARRRSVSAFSITPAQLVDACRRLYPESAFEEKGILNGLGIFQELGLLDLEATEEQVVVTVFDTEGRVELSTSCRYLEGNEELALFERFNTWVFAATSDELRERVIGPLMPMGQRDV